MSADNVKKPSAGLKKVVQISGLLGAGIIFGADFVNDHFVTALQEDTQNLDAVENDEAQIQTSAASAEDQLNAAQRMVALEQQVNALSNKPAVEELKGLFDSSDVYLDVLQSSVDILKDSTEQLAGITKRVNLSDETKKAIEATNAEVKTISETMQKENDTFKELNRPLAKIS